MRFIIFFTLLLVTSCSKTKEKDSKTNSETFHLSDSIPDIDGNDNDILKFVFPDTVDLNMKIYGKLKYNLELDSVTESKLLDRFVFLFVTSEYVEGGSKEIMERDHSIFKDTIGDGTHFFNITFDNRGKKVISLAIQDNLIFETDTDSSAINHGIKDVTIHHSVFVK
jgi:hypothetical protein